ncbi:MAG: hypothetical protein JST89_20530 [Cyanobacteria bacterium SZAS-4]|nr:hypothetical protein [Cyanobacteria bacterium SZAS-4]
MKKYPDRKNALVGRVIIRQDGVLWSLIDVDDAGVYHWLRVDEKSDELRTYYVGCVPQETKLSRDVLAGERVFYPQNLGRGY